MIKIVNQTIEDILDDYRHLGISYEEEEKLEKLFYKVYQNGIRDGITNCFYIVDSYEIIEEPFMIDTRIIHNNSVINQIKDDLKIRAETNLYER